MKECVRILRILRIKMQKPVPQILICWSRFWRNMGFRTHVLGDKIHPADKNFTFSEAFFSFTRIGEGVFSPGFLNCTNGTKSRNAPHILFDVSLLPRSIYIVQKLVLERRRILNVIKILIQKHYLLRTFGPPSTKCSI